MTSDSQLQGITILGATGSIGINTLDVIGRHPSRYRVVALTANRNGDRLYEQCVGFSPEYAVLGEAADAGKLQQRLVDAGCETKVLQGEAALEKVAALPQTDCVVAAIVGAAGLLPTLAAARAGKKLLLANKEALVMAGELFMAEVARSGACLLPVDSEHNAVFQCLPQGNAKLPGSGAARILLTGSGGPFRTTPLAELTRVTPEQACAHPNWVMGRKISVDSATMMNKGLELIEACWLFEARADQVQIVLHPQSVIHSMVSYKDGSVLAQLGNPDMRTPIAHCLAWPERMDAGVEPLDLVNVARLEFQEPDLNRFPCLRLAREAHQTGGTSAAILNAANEVAVECFLQRQVAFTDIPRIVEHALVEIAPCAADSLDAVLVADAQARNAARNYIAAAA